MNAQQVNADITALLKARNTLLWITSREEVRVERALVDVAARAQYQVFYWDVAVGIRDAKGDAIQADMRDPLSTLEWVRRGIVRGNKRERFVLVMRDLHKWLDAATLRGLRTLARDLQVAKPDEARTIVVLSPSGEVPPELGDLAVFDYPLPDRAEVSRILDGVLSSVNEKIRDTACAPDARDAAVDAAVGLSAEEAENCYARSLVTLKRVDPALVSSDKRRVISREKVLTWYDPDPRGLDAVGGLDVLKTWLRARRSAFTPAAREFGLPAPKGAFLLGIPGCGKSLTCKAVASAWGMPLLRLDMGALRSRFVGDSEANIRKALRVAETVAPCVLWADEIEKALAGATGPAGDGGVSADALGVLLSWMQERKAPVFVIATANDVRGLPPELLRKGRFDELFWVDLPTSEERKAIMAAALREHGRNLSLINRGEPGGIDLDEVAAFTEGFTGAEIAALVPDALFAAFEDGKRAVTTADLRASAATVVPLARTAAEKLGALREWAKGRARHASTPETAAEQSRTLDLDS
jgi:ATP-dependent 26S proteasome regulatory subunit